MKPSQITEALKVLINKKRPAFIWGPPGAGKSDIVRQTAHDLEIEVIDIRLSMLDPTDLKGFPIADQQKQVMRWLQADFLPNKKDWKGIVFFDEANSAPKSVEAPMYQLTLDRRLGDYMLPEGAAIIMAGNRETDRAIANRQSSALANRLVHLEYEVNLEDWIDWGIKAKKIDSQLLAFMRFRPELLHKFDPNSKAWPSPRTWMFANELMSSGLSRDTEFEMIKGIVGEGAAGEFQAFMNVWRDLPKIEDIMKNPGRAKKPETPDGKYAISTSLAEHTEGKKEFETIYEYITQFDMEYQVVYIRDCVRRDKPIENSKKFVEWSVKNADVLS